MNMVVTMFLKTFHTPSLSINSYFLADSSTRRAVVIDPIRHVESYITFAHDEDYEITDIIETHVHADFISGSKELKHALKGKPTIHCSSMGGVEWIPSYTDKKVQDGEEINLGTIRLLARHTPGHTPEHLIWIAYDDSRSKELPCLVFTGDLLFVGSVGRPDLLGQEMVKRLGQQLYHSVVDLLNQLPDFLEMYPAHGAGSLCGKSLSIRSTSTLGYEKLVNPFFQKISFEDWLTNLQKEIPAPPPNFLRIKKINAAGPPLLSEIHQMSDPLYIVDVRDPEIFAKVHIKDSLNIPYNRSFCNRFGSIIYSNSPLVLLADDVGKLHKATKELELIGYDQIIHRHVWDENALRNAYSFENLPLISVHALNEEIQQLNQTIFLIDVRTPQEWKKGHIKDSHHIELPLVKDHLDTIPRESKIYVICDGGYRASIIASLLKKEGYDASNIQGGISAWNKAGLPLSIS